MSSVDDDIDRLVEAGLLTERLATAYVLREIEAVPRDAAAESMGISVNTLDNQLRRARDIVDEAHETTAVVEHLKHPPLPSSCDKCGTTLGGRWTEEDGRPICLDCAGIDPDEIE